MHRQMKANRKSGMLKRNEKFYLGKQRHESLIFRESLVDVFQKNLTKPDRIEYYEAIIKEVLYIISYCKRN